MKSIQETIVIADRLGLEYSPTFPFLARSGLARLVRSDRRSGAGENG